MIFQNMPIFNFYATLNAEQKALYRENNYNSMIYTFISAMFNINGLSEDYKNILITTLLNNGTALLKRGTSTDKWIIAGGNFVGVPKSDEIYPTHYIATKNDYQYDGDISKDDNATVVYLNSYLAPCTEIQRFATMLADTDTSLENNIKFCRIAPVGAIQDDSTRAEFENVLTNILNGELINTVKANFNFNTNTPATLATIDLCKSEYAQNLQYLSMLHEQLLSRLCKLFGVPYNVLSKSANITTEELGNIDVFSSILPASMKRCLNTGLAKLNLKAEFSDTWKWIDEIEKLKCNPVNDKVDKNSDNNDMVENPDNTNLEENKND